MFFYGCTQFSRFHSNAAVTNIRNDIRFHCSTLSSLLVGGTVEDSARRRLAAAMDPYDPYSSSLDPIHQWQEKDSH